jgi:hypothetical protein
LRSNPVEDLNEILSVKDASMERILSRIDQTPIREIRLNYHMDLDCRIAISLSFVLVCLHFTFIILGTIPKHRISSGRFAMAIDLPW